jgi:NDP-sugar pyrophosphorylase family protein
MNVLIPLAGKGSRFANSGYDFPKPLIDILGKPMIVRAIESLDLEGNYHFVLRKNDTLEPTREALLSIKPDARIIEIDYVTDGPACTANLFREFINNDEELIIANCDQIMEWNSENFLYNVRNYDGAVVTYHSDTDKNSYAEITSKGLVKRIREKEVISNVSLNGIHYWKRGRHFVDSYDTMIDQNDRAPNGEFYIGPSYNYMIQSDLKVGIYHIICKEQNYLICLEGGSLVTLSLLF